MLDDDDDIPMIMPMNRLALIKALFFTGTLTKCCCAAQRRKREKIEDRRKYGTMRLAFFARLKYETFKSLKIY